MKKALCLCFMLVFLYSNAVFANEQPPGAHSEEALSIDFESASSAAKEVNAFALKYFSQLRKINQGNIVFSPYGIYESLLCLAEITDSENRDAIYDVLEGNDDSFKNMMELHKLIESRKLFRKAPTREALVKDFFTSLMLEQFQDDKERSDFLDWIGRYDTKIDIASNRTMLWVDSKDIEAKCSAKITESADFFEVERVASEHLLQKINEWAFRNTAGEVIQAYKYGLLRRNINNIITSASYFKSVWGSPYQGTSPRYHAFHTPDADDICVRYLGNFIKYHYIETSNCHAILLPYSRSVYSLILAKPLSSDVNIDSVSSEEFFSIVMSLLENAKIGEPEKHLGYIFPEFALYQTHSVGETLKLMRISKREVVESKKTDTDTKFDFYHTSFFNTNEEGSMIETRPKWTKLPEMMRGVSAINHYALAWNEIPEHNVFYSNSPFVFIIIENSTGLIFQMGVLKNPCFE